MRRFVVALVAALLLTVGWTAAAPDGAARAKANPIRSVKVRRLGAEGSAVVPAGVQQTFEATGVITPDEDGHPWLVFVWDFGDGVSLTTDRIDGGDGPIQDTVVHTYQSPGTYVVKCTAAHGYALLGYRFARVTTQKVTVTCSDAAPGPKRCGAVALEPFTGHWNLVWNSGDVGTLQLYEEKGVVKGFCRHSHGTGEDRVDLDLEVQGRARAGRGPSGRFHEAALQFVHNGRPIGGGVVLRMGYGETAVDAYRTGTASIEDHGFPPDAGSFGPDADAQHETARLCSILTSGRPTTRPGALLTFVLALQNEGRACLPSDRVELGIELDGATILTVKPTRVVEVASTPTQVGLRVGSLGRGGGKGDGRAAVAVIVQVDEDAGEVKCTGTVRDVDPNGDSRYADVQVPADRVLCIPVVRKPSAPAAK